MNKIFIIILIFYKIYKFIDIGCNKNLPYLCPNKKCVKNYNECNIYFGCVKLSKNILCNNGKCVNNPLKCIDKKVKCENQFENLCKDGLCRKDCSKIKYNSCDYEYPILCGNGKCVKNLYECMSSLCSYNNPYICIDNSCKKKLKKCPMIYNFQIINKTQKPIIKNMKNIIEIYNKYNLNSLIAYLEVHGEALEPNKKSIFNKIRKNNLEKYLLIRPVSIKEIKNSSIKNLTQDQKNIFSQVFNKKFSKINSIDFIRSSVIKIQSLNRLNKYELFSNYIYINIKMNNFKNSLFDIKENICLGLLIEELNKWICASYNLIRIIHQKNKYIVKYQIPKEGIYSIIFYPNNKIKFNLDNNQFCGIFCKYYNEINFIFLKIIPIIVIILYFFAITYKKLKKTEEYKNEYVFDLINMPNTKIFNNPLFDENKNILSLKFGKQNNENKRSKIKELKIILNVKKNLLKNIFKDILYIDNKNIKQIKENNFSNEETWFNILPYLRNKLK